MTEDDRPQAHRPEDEPTGPTEPLTSGDPLRAGPEDRAGQAAGETPPPPPSGGAPRRLTRTSGDRVIGGVAGGLGRYFGVDPILFRIAFVVLAFAGGVGVLAYVGLLAFVPADDRPPVGGDGNRSTTILGAVVLALAALVFLGPPLFVLGPLLLPIGLVVLVGVLLWRAVGGGGDGDPGRDVARGALVAALLIAAAGGFVGVAFAAAVGGGVVIAILAIATGVALVATAFVGGARWLILPALVLALPLALVAATGANFEGGIGHREYRPATTAQLKSHYRLGMGELVVDLRSLDLPAGRTDVDVDVGAGRAVVYVPEDACVSSDVEIGVGHANVLNRSNDGVDVALADSGSPSSDQPELHVTSDIGVGGLDVRRIDFSDGFGMLAEAACP